MQRGESSKEKCFRRAQRYLSALKCGEVPLKIEFTTFAAKKPQPLYETWIEKGLEKKELRPQAYNAQYNTQGGGGGWGIL